MPIESVNIIADLEPAYPLNTDIGVQGDDHIRLIKKALKNTFPNVDAPLTSTAAQMNFPVPIGSIITWYGTEATIPDGFVKCDGATHTRSDGGGDIVTPNLLGKFIACPTGIANVGAQQGVAGGSATATTSPSGSHTHNLAVTGGSHSHSGNTGSAGGHTHSGATTNTTGAHNHTYTTNYAGDHDHGGDTASGGNHDHGGDTASHALTTSQMPKHYHYVAKSGVKSDNDPSTPSSSKALYAGSSFSDSVYSKFSYRMFPSTTDDADVGRTSEKGSGSSHKHDISSSGSHKHDISDDGNHRHSGTVSTKGDHSHTVSIPSVDNHKHSISVTGGSHSHSGTTDANTDHTHNVDIIPPYVGLWSIMKI